MTITTITPTMQPGAVCAWCRLELPSVTALLAHGENGHAGPPAQLERGYPKSG